MQNLGQNFEKFWFRSKNFSKNDFGEKLQKNFLKIPKIFDYDEKFRKISILTKNFENLDFRQNIEGFRFRANEFQNFQFRWKISKLSISVKISKYFDVGKKNSKVSISVKISINIVSG